MISRPVHPCNLRLRCFPANTPAGKTALASRNLGTSISGHPRVIANSAALTPTIPSVPAPGFYGEDLVYFGGARLTTTKSHPNYLNMASCGGTVALCWGNPALFLNDLSNSTFIHLTDQYVGTVANNRYPASTTATGTCLCSVPM